MKMLGSRLLLLGVLAASAPGAHAALISFVDRTTFDASAPGLPVEGFEAGFVDPGLVTVCPGPLNSTSNNACFLPGGLLPGIEFSGAPDGEMALLGAGVLGNTSKALGPGFFDDTYDLTLEDANAIGFDLFSGFQASTVRVSVYEDSVLLSFFDVFATLDGVFVGVINTSGSITRINLESLSGEGEAVDSVAFGHAQISEPGTVALLLAGLAALRAARRR